MSEKINFQNELQDDSLLTSEVSDFPFAEIQSYYDRRVLKVGQGVLNLVNGIEE